MPNRPTPPLKKAIEPAPADSGGLLPTEDAIDELLTLIARLAAQRHRQMDRPDGPAAGDENKQNP